MLKSLTSKRLLRTLLRSTRDYKANLTNATSASHVYQCSSKEVEDLAQRDMAVLNDFITEEEEAVLLKDIEPKWRRAKYQFDHWDNAIQGFRETELSRWSDASSAIIQRVRDLAFTDTDHIRKSVHVLDLAPDGFIKPHVDSTRFCGRLIAGISLLTPCVMRLIHEKNPMDRFSVLLGRRSLYIMKNKVRYEYTHEILKNKESVFDGKIIEKGRRISVMCRSEVEDASMTDPSSVFKAGVIQAEP